MHKYAKIISKLNEIVFPAPPNPGLAEECEVLENSLSLFLKAAWPHVEGSKPYIHLWHVDALCEHLEAVCRGEIKKLLVSVPPRTSKTTTISIMFPAWAWLKDPELRFLFCSYSSDISMDSSRSCKLLIESDWYQQRWGHRVALSKDQAAKGHFINTASGFRIATSVGAKATGRGGSVLVLDDPNSTFESDTTRLSTNNWVSSVWPSRLNPGTLGAQILVQQRTHEMDVSGLMLKNDENNEVVRLILPMEYDPSRKCRTIILPSTNGKIWEDPRTKEGELLCPHYINEDKIRTLKIELGKYPYAAQYQQWPAPKEGGILPEKDWQVWKAVNPPNLVYTIQSWDTALTANETSAYSACTTWGIFKVEEVSHLILLSAYRGMLTFPELLKRAHRLRLNWSDTGEEPKEPSINMMPDNIIIEAKASGYSLAAEFISKGIPIHGFNPDQWGDKMQRVHRITPYIENGLVWVAARGPDFAKLRPEHQMFVDNCALFPNAESRDLVDSMTQAILYITKVKVMLKHSMDFGFRKVEIEEKNLPGFKSEELRKSPRGFKSE